MDKSVTDLSNLPIEDIYLLSPIQQGILFHNLYAPDAGVYAHQFHFVCHGPLDYDAFQLAWQRVLDRHASLRSGFVWDVHEEPLQIVYRQLTTASYYHDLRHLSEAEQTAHIAQLAEDDLRQGFDLEVPPLFRVNLLQTATDCHHLLFLNHHIIMDGWSRPIVIEEFYSNYVAIIQDRHWVPEPERPFSDYINWLQQQDMQSAETFWRRTLAGFTDPTPLQISRSNTILSPHTSSGDMQLEVYDLSKSTSDALRAVAQQNQLTLSTIMQGIWAILLSCYSGQQEVVLGVTVSGRPAEVSGIGQMVGNFINTLPLRVNVASQQSVVAWLKEVQAHFLQVQQYDYTPLVQVQNWSDVPRGLPLFETVMAFENFPPNPYGIDESASGLTIEKLKSYESNNYPLTFLVGPVARLHLVLYYNRHEFDPAIIKATMARIEHLVEAIVADPHQSLCQLPRLIPNERFQLQTQWQGQRQQYPQQDRCLHQLIEAQVTATPDKTAVLFENHTLTYAQLNQRANHLAHHLIQFGVTPDMPVAVCLDRSLDLVVTLLAILKAGGAYLPLDPTYPPGRLAYMLTDSKTAVLIHQGPPPLAATTVTHAVNLATFAWASFPDHNPNRVLLPENLAYIIYTSGSTGKPKGTMNSHRAIVNRLLWMQAEYQLQADDRVLQKTPFSFDVSVWEFFWPLLAGAGLVVARPNGHKDSHYLAEVIQQTAVTTMHFVPAMLDAFLYEEAAVDCTTLRRVICSGEALPIDRVHRFWQALPHTALHNLYGPTEAAVDVTYHPCRPDTIKQIVPIGRPISNIDLHILSPDGDQLPVGVPGELHIGGIGLARGYWQRPILTAERFVPHPFATGQRLYKTGDLARWQADGTIEFLGRLDYQVKIRGFRIELGEIEATLLAHEAVETAVVLAREDVPNQKRLVAYIVITSESAVTINQLQAHLRQRLPDYMMPSHIIYLPQIPLTPNGKIDRRALPKPGQNRPVQLEEAYVAPRTATEEILATIWAEVLSLDKVGIHDNFFALGGDSILTIRVLALTKQNDLTVTLQQIFSHPTIAELSQLIDEAQQAPVANAVAATVDDEALLAQLLDQVEEMSEDEIEALLAQSALHDNDRDGDIS